MKPLNKELIQKTIRKHYEAVAKRENACCTRWDEPCNQRGYSVEDMASVPAGSDMGLGCGNPVAIGSIKAGETVLDLGSGGGIDSFLAAKSVGVDGRIIGVDFTPEMIDKARSNAWKGGYSNVEFRLGNIENLPVDDSSVDLVISNCVVNLSTDKSRVFREAHRVLKPGGRLAISDIVTIKPLPDSIRNKLARYAGCVAGAATVTELEGMLAQAGFQDIHITSTELCAEVARSSASQACCGSGLFSANIVARKAQLNASSGAGQLARRLWSRQDIEELRGVPKLLTLTV